MATASTSHLPMAWVERLFDRLSSCYGSKFADLWRGCDLVAVKRTWAEALATFRADEIKRGLDGCMTKVFPPTLPEFLMLCRPPIDAESAFREACQQMERRETGHDKWSHPAIFWAAAAIGSFDLRNGSWSGLGKRWNTIFAAELAKGEWPEIPLRLEALPAPGKTSVSPEVAKQRIADASAKVVGADPDRCGLLWAKRPASQVAASSVFEEAQKGNRVMESIKATLIADGICTESGRLLKTWLKGGFVEVAS